MEALGKYFFKKLFSLPSAPLKALDKVFFKKNYFLH